MKEGIVAVTIYHTEKHGEENIIGDEIIRCWLNKSRIIVSSFICHDFLDELICENSIDENSGIVIAKIIFI